MDGGMKIQNSNSVGDGTDGTRELTSWLCQRVKPLNQHVDGLRSENRDNRDLGTRGLVQGFLTDFQDAQLELLG